MKAAVITSPGQVAITEVSEPILAEYDVLCRILACSVCSGTDHNLVQGHPYHKVQFPALLGHEAIGEVIACGPKVKNLKIGDTVTRIVNRLPEGSPYTLRYGGFAERGIATDWQAMKADGLPEEQWKPHTVNRVLPASFDPIESTLIITWRETLSFFKQFNLTPEDHLLILGSGANALAFVDHARNSGVTHIAVIGNESKTNHFISQGAQAFVSYKNTDPVSVLKEKNFSRVTCIIDAIGKSESANIFLPLLTEKGKLGLYGLESYLDYTLDQASVPKDFSFFDGTHYDEGSAHDEVIQYITEKKLNAWNYLSKDHIYPLSRISDALQASKDRKVLKSVIKMTE